MTRPLIGFVGMTHLGLVSGASASEQGFNVICFDTKISLIEHIRQGKLPVSEPKLDHLIIKNLSRLHFTSNPSDLHSCDVIYVAPDVPTDDQGNSDLRPINNLLELVFQKVGSKTTIVIHSQVPPGFTRSHDRPDRTLFYQVETLIFGCAVDRARQPERYIVGCSDPSAEFPDHYREFLEAFSCPIIKMRYESAELAKISINMCLVASVSVANTLAELCENIGADWSEIVPALKLDKRIGKYSYLAPGLGIAGGNLERDLATVCNLADLHGSDARVVRAWIANSHHRRDWAIRTLYREVLHKIEDPVIGILGLAYKQDTHSIKNSPSIALLQSLKPYRVRLFDPVVSSEVVTNPRRFSATSELDACKGADVVAIMTPWLQFGKLDPKALALKLRGKIILDPFAVLNSSECRDAGLFYHTLGKN
jgi:UDPglucose 6-dehydrogenase